MSKCILLEGSVTLSFQSFQLLVIVEAVYLEKIKIIRLKDEVNARSN